MGYRSLSYTKPLWELTDLPLYRSKFCLIDPDLIEKKSQGYSSSRNPIDRKTRATVLSNNNIPVSQVEKPSYYKQCLVIKMIHKISCHCQVTECFPVRLPILPEDHCMVVV